MSVYTPITHAQLDDFFDDYLLGKVIHFEGIANGIDNTNYRVTTSYGDFVLTLFESLTDQEVSHVINLLSHLGANNLPCPIPQPDRQNRLLRQLNYKSAAVFQCLSGVVVNASSITQCRAVGEHLARLHVCTKDVLLPLTNTNDLPACKVMFNNIKEHVSTVDAELIEDEFNFQAQHSWSSLPGGVIHGDLFKDNVLFTGDQLSGILDFYSACNGPWLLDVAITVNDWCCDNGKVNIEKTAALLAAYKAVRPLQTTEQLLWPMALRAAALRFWLSRLQHQIFPRFGTIVQQKDPQVFRRILQQHRQPQSVSKPVSTNANIFITRKSA